MSSPRHPRGERDVPWYAQPRRYPPQQPDIPWYLQRPDRPAPSAAPDTPTTPANSRGLVARAVAGAFGVALLAAIAGLVVSIPKLTMTGGADFDVNRVQAGVLQTLSDPASGYGANSVTDVRCNGGRNPSAAKGTTFTCDATVNGAQRHVDVLVSDDNGTYEIDGPR